MTDNKSLIPDVPFHPGPVYRPPHKPIRPVMSNQQSSPTEDINPNINLDFEENFRRVYGLKFFKDQTNHFFHEPKELGDLINKGNLIQKFFAKAGRYGQNSESNSKKSIERNTLTSRH